MNSDPIRALAKEIRKRQIVRLDQVRRLLVLHALRQTRGDVKSAAQRLHISVEELLRIVGVPKSKSRQTQDSSLTVQML